MTSGSDYQQLWHRYDTSEEDNLLLEKHHLCHDMFYSATDENLKKLIQSEWDLQSFCISILRLLERIDDFKLSIIKPYIMRFKELCDENTIAYYKKRFETTQSTINKSRYAIVCWFLTNDPHFLDESINLILKFPNDSTKKTIDRIHYLIAVFNLLQLYHLEKFKSQVSDLAVTLFYHFSNTEPRWMMEPTKIFVKLNKSADYNLINNMITKLHNAAHQFFLKENYHLHQSLLETSLLLVSLTSLELPVKERLKQIIHTMIGESKEHDGHKRWKKGEAIGAVWCFEQAKENYEKSGDCEKITELLENIRKATQDIQWKEFKYEFKMPKLTLNGNNADELINSIHNYQEKIPNQDFIQQDAQKQLRDNPLLSAVSYTTFSKKNPISHAGDDDSHLYEKIKQLSTWNIRLGENRLSLAVKILEGEKKIALIDFIKFFKRSSIVDSDQLSILKSGIKNHFKEDYIASIHTLIPQIEGMLRRVFESKGISVLKTKRGNIMDTELGSILSKPEAIQVLGRDFANYLRIKYADPSAINQRNEVSHAIASISEFNYSNSLSLIHDLMILSTISQHSLLN